MRILFITPFNFIPPYWGGANRTYNMIKHLAPQVGSLNVICPTYKQIGYSGEDSYSAQLVKLGVRLYEVGPPLSYIQYINPLLFAKALTLARKADIVLCDYCWSSLYALSAKLFLRKKYVLMQHNVEYEIARQTGYENPTLTKIVEKMACRHASRIFCVSPNDCALIERHYGRRPSLLINGYDDMVFYPKDKPRLKDRIKEEMGIASTAPMILFYGKMDYYPNREAASIISSKIAPYVLKRIPDAGFVVIGGGAEVNLPYIKFTGAKPNIEDYINASDVVIIPLLKGGGTRIKILEAVACGKPVVTTTKGAENLLDAYTEPFLHITDDWATFSDHIVRLASGYFNRRPVRGFAERYAWRNVFKGLPGELSEYIGESNPHK